MLNAIGIDIGGTHLRVARVGADGRIAAHLSCQTPRQPEQLLAEAGQLAASLCDGDTRAIGVGVPSRVDAASGRIFPGGFVDLSGWQPPLHLAPRIDLPVVADNDASMALLAEARIGAARGVAEAVMLTIGTGVGGALLSRGRIFHGGGLAGQLGHVTVDSAGPLCVCGRSGCLEIYSSGTALGRHIAAAGLAPETRIADLLSRSDPVARAVIAAWAGPLRSGVDSLVVVTGPQCVVIGGGLGAAAVVALERFPAPSTWFQCPVVAAALGDQAGVIGAALAALDRVS